MTKKAHNEIPEVKCFCRCSRCNTDLHVEQVKLIKEFPLETKIVVDAVVDPHLCTEYVDDNGTKMKQVKDHNDALQKRNTELVLMNRSLRKELGDIKSDIERLDREIEKIEYNQD